MDTSNGHLYTMAEKDRLSPETQARLVNVKRDLTKIEEAERQIRMYSPCGCGSGKKFKFCCYKPDNP